MCCLVCCVCLGISARVLLVVLILEAELGLIPISSCGLSVLGWWVMSTVDQFVTYDLSFWIAMSTSNITQNADMMSAFLFSDSSVADGVIRSSMYAGLCVYI